MSRYIQLADGEGMGVPNKAIFKFACCDCGLVHRIAIVASQLRKGTTLGFAVERDQRATAQRRRRKVTTR